MEELTPGRFNMGRLVLHTTTFITTLALRTTLFEGERHVNPLMMSHYTIYGTLLPIIWCITYYLCWLGSISCYCTHLYPINRKDILSFYSSQCIYFSIHNMFYINLKIVQLFLNLNSFLIFILFKNILENVSIFYSQHILDL